MFLPLLGGEGRGEVERFIRFPSQSRILSIGHPSAMSEVRAPAIR
jgi:hypothetical protein